MPHTLAAATSRRTLDVGATRFDYVSLAAVLERDGGTSRTLPYALRVVVENIARHEPRLGAKRRGARRASRDGRKAKPSRCRSRCRA
jgi:aconitase A